MQFSSYVGRFAPSPTGPLHLGSLTAALASWVDARAHNGQWLLRMEDIDPEREQIGARDSIVQSLSAHGLDWDSPVTYQSDRSAVYEAALATLRTNNRLYACTCTRKKLRSVANAGGSRAYPGVCRNAQHAEADSALRITVPAGTMISFNDINYGETIEDVATTVGDFIVRRRGPFYAYQLAAVVDDAAQEVSHVVRGADLLDNTARQIVLQRALGYSQPNYLHVPVVTNGEQKLSKQSGAAALDNGKPLQNLILAWSNLGQEPPATPNKESVSAFLTFAVSRWARDRIGHVPVNIRNNTLVNTNS